MKSKLFIIASLAAALLSSCAVQPAFATDWSSTYDHVIEGTVKISITAEQEGQEPINGTGSGWMIGNNIFVTAAHVVALWNTDDEKSTSVFISGNDAPERKWISEVLYRDTENDVAFIKIKDSL